ncbi:MAG: HepT-like ribonuclease domain-containing protein [Cyclobacteriaceae bacterium]|nr:HepT-like ribonuclease domain-containing protein [Cyclobacteriaceae bacterium]
MQNERQFDILACLKDIEQSIKEIYEFLPADRNFFTFQKDLKTRKAVERNIEIIGEAMDRLLRADPSIKITDSRKIVDTRNRIIHGYDSVSEDIIWLIVNRHLPIFEKEVKKLLK